MAFAVLLAHSFSTLLLLLAGREIERPPWPLNERVIKSRRLVFYCYSHPCASLPPFTIGPSPYLEDGDNLLHVRWNEQGPLHSAATNIQFQFNPSPRKMTMHIIAPVGQNQMQFLIIRLTCAGNTICSGDMSPYIKFASGRQFQSTAATATI